MRCISAHSASLWSRSGLDEGCFHGGVKGPTGNVLVPRPALGTQNLSTECNIAFKVPVKVHEADKTSEAEGCHGKGIFAEANYADRSRSAHRALGTL
jgi:hypothetical protein